MNSTDLAFTSALEQAELIRSKAISPLELTQVYLDRIQTIDGSLNSFFTVMADQAIAEAKSDCDRGCRVRDSYSASRLYHSR